MAAQTPATTTSTVTPEPGSIWLLATGLLGTAAMTRRRLTQGRLSGVVLATGHQGF